jgi:acetate kinase
MPILTLSGSHQVLDYSAWQPPQRTCLWSGSEKLALDGMPHHEVLLAALGRLRQSWYSSVGPEPPMAIGLRVVLGSPRFRGPTLATPSVLSELDQLVQKAPLHLPAALALARALGESLPESPLVLVFETAFFSRLPVREQTYGLDSGLAGSLELRRSGYHGIYHRAACSELVRRLAAQGGLQTPRMLSICLEPRPELASVSYDVPLTVTSGTTPLEGLPGDSSAGEADPAIVLTLAQEGGLGPEAIDHLLTRESGLTGLCGRPTTLPEIVSARDEAARHALAVFQHRLLVAAGAGVAALGGLDGIVFSGRYAHTGAHFGPFLRDRLERLPGLSGRGLPWLIFSDPWDRLVAYETLAALPVVTEMAAREAVA